MGYDSSLSAGSFTGSRFEQYILWINDNKHAWTARAGGFAADERVQIGPRPIPQEPMVFQTTLLPGGY